MQLEIYLFTNSLLNTHAHAHRLFVQAHDGLETDKEAILLAYQVSKSVHSGEYPMVSMEKAVAMAATMAQMEHGDWEEVEGKGQPEEVAQEAILRFCPWQMTHMALDHTLSHLRRKLVEYWQTLAGKGKEGCARSYLSTAQQWSHYGATTFQAEVSRDVCVRTCVCVSETLVICYSPQVSHASINDLCTASLSSPPLLSISSQ